MRITQHKANSADWNTKCDFEILNRAIALKQSNKDTEYNKLLYCPTMLEINDLLNISEGLLKIKCLKKYHAMQVALCYKDENYLSISLWKIPCMYSAISAV